MLWWLPVALAQDTGLLSPEETARFDDAPEPSETDILIGEEILVVDELEIQRRRQEVIDELGELGYEQKRRRDGRTVLVDPVPYHPKVVIDDDGWMYTRRRPVVLTRPDFPDMWWGDTPLELLTCAVAPYACVRIGGLVISKRKYAHHKEVVIEATEDEMAAFADAIAAKAVQDKMYGGLPEQLDRIWLEGVGVAGEALPTPEDRKRAILAMWADRTCTEYGEAIRQQIEAYLVYVIQMSTTPLTFDEVAVANEACTCLGVELTPESW